MVNNAVFPEYSALQLLVGQQTITLYISFSSYDSGNNLHTSYLLNN